MLSRASGGTRHRSSQALYLFDWLLSLPFRLVGITLEAAFAFLKALLFLPARILGGPRPA